ncbi:hypothetical protein BDZ85DRAFT_281081 [Elsinoe ampelina]|uniref:AA1-like domain-containing protein n=1 Tax=Elsinoe ampelina TaxID=302913 RepID=A0A6A6GFL1_9PEZI|nr:hypothetical protein BDZ85DRAFT_281081 [Elsinoe ampelina]
MKFSVASALPLYFLVLEATAACTRVGNGAGNLGLKCKSYTAPTKLLQTVSSDSNALSIQYVANPAGTFQYRCKNNMAYDINYGVQYWNPGPQSNAWQTFTIKAGTSDCVFNLPGHMEVFKLTC